MKYPNANAAFSELFDFITVNGKTKDNTKYLRNISFTIENPMSNSITVPFRKWNRAYAELEFEWYKTADKNPGMVEKKAKIWSLMKDDSGYDNSNYGNWWARANQYFKIIGMLKRDKNTRRAVVVHYNPDEIDSYTKDTPCNLVLNFYIENKTVCMTVFARSIDLVYGFCNDQYCFSKLLEDAAYRLELPVGTSHYFITDLHVYEKHFKMKEKFHNESIQLFK